MEESILIRQLIVPRQVSRAQIAPLPWPTLTREWVSKIGVDVWHPGCVGAVTSQDNAVAEFGSQSDEAIGQGRAIRVADVKDFA